MAICLPSYGNGEALQSGADNNGGRSIQDEYVISRPQGSHPALFKEEDKHIKTNNAALFLLDF